MNNYIEKGIAHEDTSKHPSLWAGFFYAYFSFTKLTITNCYIIKVSRTFGASKQ